MDKRKILIQLDSDPHPSVFDRVVAIDAGADELFSYGGVKPEQVQRPGPRGHLHARAEGPEAHRHLHRRQRRGGRRDSCWPRRASTCCRSSACASRCCSTPTAPTPPPPPPSAPRPGTSTWPGAPALVLGGTGPVGQRVARLLARQGARRPRRLAAAATRGRAVCEAIRGQGRRAPSSSRSATATPDELPAALAGRTLVIAAGAAGVVLLPKRRAAGLPRRCKVAIDLNAVPPLGIEGVEVTDKGDGARRRHLLRRHRRRRHQDEDPRAAVAKLFESNDQVLDAEEVYALGRSFNLASSP